MTYAFRRSLCVALGFGTIGILAVAPAMACSCGPVTADDVPYIGLIAEGEVTAIEKMTAVNCATLHARMETIRSTGGILNYPRLEALQNESKACQGTGFIAEFLISTIWKGTAPNPLRFGYYLDGGGDCGMNLEVGTRLTIFSHSENGDEWRLMRCSVAGPDYVSRVDQDGNSLRPILEQYRDRLTDLTKATKASPNDPLAWAALGAHLETGDLTEAEKAYTRVIELAPDQSIGYLGLARTQSRQDKIEEASKTLALAASHVPADPEIEKFVLRVDFLLGSKGDPAKVDFRNFVSSRPIDLSNLDLRGKDFSGARLKFASFDGSKLDGASFRDVVFSDGASFDGASLEDADFTGASLGEASFRNANAVRASFAGARGFFVTFRGVMLDGASFRDAPLNAKFDGSSMRDVDFSYLSAPDAEHSAGVSKANDFLNSDLTGARFAGRTIMIERPSEGMLSVFERADLGQAILACYAPRNSWFAGERLDKMEEHWNEFRAAMKVLIAIVESQPGVFIAETCAKVMKLHTALPADCRPWHDPAGKAPYCALPE